MRRDLPTGTVTFLFSDVQGSTKLLHELGPEAYGRLLWHPRTVLRAPSAANGGVEVDTQGDAFLIAFASAAGAVAAAREARDKLASGPIRVRMGLHSGTPHLTEEGYVGEDVHLGARITSAGHGGQVLLSATTRSSVDAQITELGEHRLKDFAHAISIFQLGNERFPPLKTISNTNLPRPASSFIGREHEVARIVSLIRGGARLVTLAGPGGTGKTRLAIEAGSELVGEFKAGVFWVDLSPIRDPALVTKTISQVLGANDGLAAHVAEREMLLLIDNLEQVVKAAPDLGQLLEACPNLYLLVTSRTLLRLRGEVEYAVQPLAERDAVELFCVRANAAADATVAEICRRLDHLPLAIELAAARAKVLSPAQIAERLAQRLPLLTSGARDLPERQQTLRGAIAWSYDLLSANERRLFKQLGVFVGGCTLEAAEAICEADLDDLASLIDKSLLRRDGDRYLMLDTIREYALETLGATDGLERVSGRHANYYLVLAGRIDSRVGGSMSPNAHEQVDQERDNWRTAIRGALERGERRLALELVVALQQFWVKHGHLVEGLSWLNAALPLSDAPADLLLRAKADQLACEIDLRAGDLVQARIHCDSGLGIAREARDNNLIAWIHSDLAMLSHFDGVEDATAHFEQAHTLFANAGDTYGAASVLNNWANVEVSKGRLDPAVELVTEAIKLCRNCTDSGLLAATLHTSGTTQLMLGDPNSALAAMEEALRTSLLARDNGLILECADGIMGALAALERWEDAARVMGFAAEFRAANGIRDWTSTAFGERYVQGIREALPAGHLGEAMMRGRMMSLLDVVGLARAEA